MGKPLLEGLQIDDLRWRVRRKIKDWVGWSIMIGGVNILRKIKKKKKESMRGAFKTLPVEF